MKRNKASNKRDAGVARKTSASNKAVSILLSLAMCPMLVPTAAFAAEDGTQPGASVVQTQNQQNDAAAIGATGESEATYAEDSSASSADQVESFSQSGNYADGIFDSVVFSAEGAGSESGTVVAKVGEKTYSTLNDAVVDAANEGGTVVLQANVKVSSQIKPTGNVSIDLAGYVIENSCTGTLFSIQKDSSLTITDANDSGKVVSENKAIVYSNQPNSVFTLAGGSLVGTFSSKATAKTSNYVINAGAYLSVNIKGGSVVAEGSGTANAVIYSSQTTEAKASTINICGGKILDQTVGTKDKYAYGSIYASGYANINLLSGEIYSPKNAINIKASGSAKATVVIGSLGASSAGLMLNGASNAVYCTTGFKSLTLQSGTICGAISGANDSVTSALRDNASVTMSNSDAFRFTDSTVKAILEKHVTDYIISDQPDENGFYVVASKALDNVAMIGNTGYPSLQSAIEAVQAGETIKLAGDIDLTQSDSALMIDSSKNFSLDLFGHKLKAENTNTGNIQIKGGSLTLCDTSQDGDGRIYSETPYVSGSTDKTIINVTGGSFVMNSGTIDAASAFDDPANQGQFGIGVFYDPDSKVEGSIVINGGTVMAGRYCVAGIGSDQFNGQNAEANITVNGGTLESTADYAIYHPQKGTTTINGGVVYGAAGGVQLNRGHFIMLDGLVTSKGTGSTGNWGDGTGNTDAAAININAKYGDADAAISGGKVTAEKNALMLTTGAAHKGTIGVSGGEFSSPVSEGYCAEGFIPVTKSDGLYGVAGSVVAKIGDAQYGSLQEAFSSAKSGDTVVLANDVVADAALLANNIDVVFDLNGYTLTFPAGLKVEGFAGVHVNGASLTVKDSSDAQTGAIDSSAAGYAFNVIKTGIKPNGGSLVIESGKFTGNTSVVQVECGSATVKGGSFAVMSSDGYGSDYLLNCIDDAYKAGNASINVTGGKFKSFDPSNNTAEGEGTNFVAEGYNVTTSTVGDDTMFTVAEKPLPVEIWTGYSGTKVGSYATLSEAVEHLSDNKWLVISEDYTLSEDFVIPEGVFLDINKDATLKVASGVTLTVAANSKRLGVRSGAKLVSEGTVLVCGTSYTNGFVMVQSGGDFDINSISVPDGYIVERNNTNYYAAEALYEISYSDGTVKKTGSLSNLADAVKVTLLKDIDNFTYAFSSIDKVNSEFVLDLNGKTLSGKEDASSAVLTISVPMTIKNGTIKYLSSNNSAGALRTAADVTIDNDAVIDGGEGYGVWTEGYGHTLTVDGVVKSDGSYAITGNGSESGGLVDECNVVVNNGSNISAENGIGIYHPETGAVTVNGGSISGNTGIQICAGSLVVNGGDVTSIGANVDATGSQNAILDGSALSIVNRGYPGGVPSAEIAGGTFRANVDGAQTIKAYDYEGNAVADWTNASESIKVYGGAFNNVPSNMSDLVKQGYGVVLMSDGMYHVVKQGASAGKGSASGSVATDGVTVGPDEQQQIANSAAVVAESLKKGESESATDKIGNVTVDVASEGTVDKVAAVKEAAKTEDSSVSVKLVVKAEWTDETNKKIEEVVNLDTTEVVPFELSVDMVTEVKNAEDVVTATATVPVKETASEITVAIAVDPGSIANKNVTVARVHEGKVDIIKPESVDYGNGVVTFKTGKFSDYAVLASAKSVTLSEYTETDDKTRKSVDPATFGLDSTYAFAGWYTDEALTNPCRADTDLSTEVYPKFVKVSDLIIFKGGSLRMDIGDPATYTYLRFGYAISIPAGTTFVENGWYYKRPIDAAERPLVAYNNALNSDGSVTANIVFREVPVERYAPNYKVRAYVKYVTPDGSNVEIAEDSYQERSVVGVADEILVHPMANAVEKNYANSIKNAIA